MIPFNKAVYLPRAAEYVEETLKSSKIAGDGKYTRLCTEWMEKKFQAKKILLTTSCTAALEMSAILLYICNDCKCVCVKRSESSICGYSSGYNEY